jgi:hypothetical protein
MHVVIQDGKVNLHLNLILNSKQGSRPKRFFPLTFVRKELMHMKRLFSDCVQRQSHFPQYKRNCMPKIND